MNVSPKYKKILNYIVGPVLFVILAFSIYRKITAQPHLRQSWQSMQNTIGHNRYLLLLMLALMLMNWAFEARKWQLLIRPVQRVSLFKGFKAVLSGLSFSIFIPNGIGEYFGRMLYLDEGNRLRSVVVSFTGSLAQILITLICGVIGLNYLFAQVPAYSAETVGLSGFWLKAMLYAVYAFIALFLLLYFKISLFAKLFEKIPFVHKHRIFIDSLETYQTSLLLRILFISFVRYLVFIAQYLLVFYLFNVAMPLFWAICSVSVLFLSMAIVPTIPIAELGVRGEISLKVFGILTQNALGIVSSAAFIWLVNIIVPSLAGSLFVLNARLFKKPKLKNEA